MGGRAQRSQLLRGLEFAGLRINFNKKSAPAAGYTTSMLAQLTNGAGVIHSVGLITYRLELTVVKPGIT